MAELPRALARINRAIEADLLQLHKDVTKAVHYEVVYRTPVDVGTARSNWLVSQGVARVGTVKAFFPYPSRWLHRVRLANGSTRAGRGRGGTRAESSNLLASQLAADQAISSLTYSDAMVTNITNNLPYIMRLQEGWSKQSSAGLILRGVPAGTRKAFAAFKWRNLRKL